MIITLQGNPTLAVAAVEALKLYRGLTKPVPLKAYLPTRVFNIWKSEIEANLELYPDSIDRVEDGGNTLYWGAFDMTIKKAPSSITTVIQRS